MPKFAPAPTLDECKWVRDNITVGDEVAYRRAARRFGRKSWQVKLMAESPYLDPYVDEVAVERALQNSYPLAELTYWEREEFYRKIARLAREWYEDWFDLSEPHIGVYRFGGKAWDNIMKRCRDRGLATNNLRGGVPVERMEKLERSS